MWKEARPKDRKIETDWSKYKANVRERERESKKERRKQKEINNKGKIEKTLKNKKNKKWNTTYKVRVKVI